MSSALHHKTGIELYFTASPSSAKSTIVGHTNHPSSVARIQEIEAPKPAAEEVPDVTIPVGLSFFCRSQRIYC